jgi:trimethylamine--corrinoid protein Co-methyltransferase
MRVLEDLGLKVEHPVLLGEMRDFGFRVDFDRQVVRFGRDLAEPILDGMGGHQLDLTGSLRFNASGFVSHYLEPERDTLRPHTLESHRRFVGVCNALPRITSITCQGLPSDVPPQVLNLHLKVLSLCWTEKPYSSGELERPEEVPFYQEICNLYEAEHGRAANSTAAVGVRKIQPMRLDRDRAELMLKCRACGVHAPLGGIAAMMGGNAPITPAGATVTALASQFSSLLFNYASEVVRGVRSSGDYPILTLTANAGVYDMRTAHALISRPEAWRANLMLAAMARFYGARGLIYGGCKTQAKTVASVQSATERFGDMLAGFYAGATSYSSLGSIGEPQGINSAVQLVIDHELAGILRFLAGDAAVEERTLGVEAILRQGHDPVFMADDHTAEHFRRDTWFPDIFVSGDTYANWETHGSRTEIDRARQRAVELWRREPELRVGEDCYREMLGVIDRAREVL